MFCTSWGWEVLKKIKLNKLNNELYQLSFLIFLKLYSGFNFVSDNDLIVSHETTAH